MKKLLVVLSLLSAGVLAYPSLTVKAADNVLATGTLASGTYTLTADTEITGQMVIAKTGDVVIDLNGYTLTTKLDGEKASFKNKGKLTIKDSQGNGAIKCGTDIEDYDAWDYPCDGGCIYNTSTGKLTVEGGTIQNYFAWYGAAVYNSGTCDITGGTFTNNFASFEGGAVYNSGVLTITGGAFTANESGFYGGALYSQWSTSDTITGGTFTNNEAEFVGGGLYFDDCNNVTFGGTVVVDNNKGGVFQYDEEQKCYTLVDDQTAEDNIAFEDTVIKTKACAEGMSVGITAKPGTEEVKALRLEKDDDLKYFSCDDNTYRFDEDEDGDVIVTNKPEQTGTITTSVSKIILIACLSFVGAFAIAFGVFYLLKKKGLVGKKA